LRIIRTYFSLKYFVT